MPWKAILTDWDLDAPSVTYGFYDDADPLNTPDPKVFLYSQVFSRADINTNPELQAAVVVTGVKIRKVYNRVQAIKNAGPVTIP